MTSLPSTEACIMDDVHSSRVTWISLRSRGACWSHVAFVPRHLPSRHYHGNRTFQRRRSAAITDYATWRSVRKVRETPGIIKCTNQRTRSTKDCAACFSSGTMERRREVNEGWRLMPRFSIAREKGNLRGPPSVVAFFVYRGVLQGVLRASSRVWRAESRAISLARVLFIRRFVRC